MNWFEEWFDSPLYEKLYSNRDEEEAALLINLLEENLDLDKSDRILDLGCGRGRHSINLARKGYRVKGIDLSEQAIQKARKRAEELGLEEIEFEVRDMRNPLPETFDAIVNLFTTFGYFASDKENVRVLDSVTTMLKPGGTFVLDYLNAKKVEKDYNPSDEGEFQGIHYDIHRYIDHNSIIKEIEFSGEKVGEAKRYSERVKLYGLEWFRERMEERNLEVEHVFGDYRGGAFDPQESPRLLIISRYRGE